MKTEHKILIVDDKRINRYMLADIFCDEYEIVEAADGEAAIKLMMGDFDSYAVVLLDIIMPGIDGFGVLDFMRERKILDKLPVVVVTNDASEETGIRALEYKVADIVIRPFEPLLIKRRVQNIIELYAYRKKYGNG